MANSNERDQVADQAVVMIRDHERFVQMSQVDDWDAMTMLAAVSSDPRSFHELDLAWQRYRGDQRLQQLPWEAADRENPQCPWLLIDLACQRMVSNDPEMIPDSPAGFQREEGEWEPSNPVIWCNAPPWWEIRVETQLEAALPPLPIWREPTDFRGILYGRSLAEALAQRMLAVLDTESVPDFFLHPDQLPWDKPLDKRQRKALSRWHELTVRVHADWLMTPRQDLEGKPPRHFLHEGREWVDREIENRRRQWSKLREPPKPLDRDTYAYRHGPMGLAEVATYFDLCRELINAGWGLLRDATTDRSKLSVMLHEHEQAWLAQGVIDGDGTPPGHIIECSRRHMPQIVGTEPYDCNCPICRMMAEQSESFGLGFMFFDGHHLELDNEFAFSLCETREEWEQEQADYNEIVGTDAATQEPDEPKPIDLSKSDDEFDSVWKTSYVADGLLGDAGVSTMALAFRVSELVTDLQLGPGDQAQVTRLNQLFDAVRHAEADWSRRRDVVRRLQQHLELLANAYPRMTGKIADFHSQLDEWCRQPANDMPF